MRSNLQRFVLVAAGVAAVLAISSPAGAGDAAMVARGKYLVNLGGCNDCHTPKVMTERGPIPDASRTLSGHPASATLPDYDPAIAAPGHWILFNNDLTACVGPWGTSYAANLTPDDQTGIGLWSLEQFVGALRTGKHMGAGRPIMPPMPWQTLAEVSDDDLAAMFAYLKSLDPIKNAVPAPAPPREVGSH